MIIMQAKTYVKHTLAIFLRGYLGGGRGGRLSLTSIRTSAPQIHPTN